jgi:hypothetical protein
LPKIKQDIVYNLAHGTTCSEVTMANGLNGRIEYRPIGRDPYQDLGLLSDALAKLEGLFEEQGGGFVWIADGKRRGVARDLLLEIIQTHVVIATPVNRGTADAENWVVEYRPAPVSEMLVRSLLIEPRERGGLSGRLAKIEPPNTQSGLRLRPAGTY